jgi:hypothetical protein
VAEYSLAYGLRFGYVISLISGSMKVLDYAIQIGVDIDAVNIAGDSPVISAVKKNRLEAVKKVCATATNQVDICRFKR